MGNRDVQIIIPIKSGSVKEARRLAQAMGEFPTIAWNYAEQIAALLSKELLTPEDGEELAVLVAGLKADAERAGEAHQLLAPIVYGAFIQDPEGRKNLGGMH